MKFITNGEVSELDLCKMYLHRKGTAAAGVSEKYWEIGAGATGVNGNGVVAVTPATPIDVVFSGVDDCGILVHPNPTDQENILTQAIPTDPTGNIAHESELDFWVRVPDSSAKLIARVNGYSSYAVYFGSCVGKLKQIEKGVNNTFAGAAFYNIDLGAYAGTYVHVKLFSHDPHQSGKTILQWDVGAGPEDIPIDALLAEQPVAGCYPVWFDHKSGKKFFQDGTEILDTEWDCFSCNPCAEFEGEVAPQKTSQTLCLEDVQADGTRVDFLRTYIYSITGEVFSVTDTTEDGSEYEVTGSVAKPDDCQLCKVYLHEKGTVENGVTEEYWEIGVGATGTNGNGTPGLPAGSTPAIDTIFTETDECGHLAHPNPTDAVNVLTQAIPTDPSGSDLAHESILDYWVYVPKPGAELVARVNGWSSYAVYFGGCNSKLKEVERGINTTAAGAAFIDIPLGSQGSGFFHVRTYSHDPGSSGKTILQWSLGGGPLEDIPQENLFATKPSAYCEDLWYSKQTGVAYFKDGSVYDPDDYLQFACDPCSVDPGLPADIPDNCSVTIKCFEDKAPTGEKTNFIRNYVYNADGSLKNVYDTTVDGTAYVVSGVVCENAPDNDSPAIFNRTYDVDDTGPVGLDLSEVDGDGNYCAATCALIQNYGSGDLFVTLNNGSEPAGLGTGDPVGMRLTECASIWVGDCKESPAGGREDLANLQMIAEVGSTTKVFVQYFRKREP